MSGTLGKGLKTDKDPGPRTQIRSKFNRATLEKARRAYVKSEDDVLLDK